ncbi:D-isomer specific 2-hydroxyacid dehydrogenase family protein [Agreia sp. VKM Ac-1783]|uniref:D-isomer specific 2-hydroxyacid dehydrogenase family protein n=1 Tax=Agreia sp. VKM Ac-1783 TaxID=1938889 RepID=UPI000A2AD157|nr:D-isomer specific 2-hydroxyacid dehydrogenase family protein [Agreia sp. VKM Ac-1783]SMQ67940.1 Phosphoglycerate dehydrogenase [Agreia sp. VKM Ac-1783]
MSAQQHREILAAPAYVPADDARPVPGPIAVLPEPVQLFVDAVESAGGRVSALSEETRGLIWLDPSGSERFGQVLSDNPQLSWIQLPYAGVDAFADILKRFARPTLTVTSAKGAFAQPVAEHALMLALALLRRLPLRLSATSWGDGTVGTSLYGLHVVIVGAGGIAIELIRLLRAFGVTITVVRRGSEPVDGASATVSTNDLDAILPTADVVVLAAALTDDTRGLIGGRQFAEMKNSAVLVNIGRGGLIVTDALVDAIQTGSIAGAGIDVTDPEPLPDGHPLWIAPNIIITPHSADTPAMTRPLLARRVSNNTRAFLGRGGFDGVVDPVVGY